MEKRVGLFTLALLLLLACVAFAQQPFADVPTSHWAYKAVSDLQSEGVVAGYPDGYFRGNRMLSRYEFAQALFRLKQVLQTGSVQPADNTSLISRIGQLEADVAALKNQAPVAGLTAAQADLLRRLESEFAPELKALRADFNALAVRVGVLEQAQGPAFPKITVGGSIAIRGGFYGTELGTGDRRTTGYPFGVAIDQADGVVPYGAINFVNPFTGTGILALSITDATKDAFKANDFMQMQDFVKVNAALNEKVDATISLRMDARGNNQFDANEVAEFTPWFGNTLNTVRVDEAWIRAKTRLIAPLTVTAGQQYFGFGEGLLADNSQFPLKALRLDFAPGRTVSFGGIVGMLDREALYGMTTGNLAGLVSAYLADRTSGQDNYNLYYLKMKLGKRFNVGFNWLASGVANERGWGADMSARLLGLDWSGEYARLDRDIFGQDPSGFDKAWVARVGRSSKSCAWSVKYGQVDALYGFAVANGVIDDETVFFAASRNGLLTSLHPDSEFNPYDINWVDRPLFLDPTNVARGWEGQVKLGKVLGSSFPLELRYYGGDAYTEDFLGWLLMGQPGPRPDQWRKADSVWTVKVSHDIAKDVTASLLYGHRDAKHVLSPIPGVLNDAIQTVRAEVSVGF